MGKIIFLLFTFLFTSSNLAGEVIPPTDEMVHTQIYKLFQAEQEVGYLEVKLEKPPVPEENKVYCATIESYTKVAFLFLARETFNRQIEYLDENFYLVSSTAETKTTEVIKHTSVRVEKDKIHIRTETNKNKKKNVSLPFKETGFTAMGIRNYLLTKNFTDGDIYKLHLLNVNKLCWQAITLNIVGRESISWHNHPLSTWLVKVSIPREGIYLTLWLDEHKNLLRGELFGGISIVAQ